MAHGSLHVTTSGFARRIRAPIARHPLRCSARPDHDAERVQSITQPVNEIAQIAGFGSKASSQPAAQPNPAVSSDTMVVGLVVAQGITLVGSLVGGHLARARRLKLTKVNAKLRKVVHELRKKQEEEQQALVCEAAPEEANLAYQRALETSMSKPSAAHPEEYGDDARSLTSARRKIAKELYDAKDALAANDIKAALELCHSAFTASGELTDKRAQRAVLRVRARAETASGETDAAISSLEAALELSQVVGDVSGDVDTLSNLADIYVDRNDFERAGEIYDAVIAAIKIEDESVPISSTWDC